MTDRPRSFRVGHQSHPGPRKTNQDTVLSIGLPDERWLVAVADGMGGLTEGEMASKTALSALFRSLSKGADLVEAVREANTAVLREAPDISIGTTLVAAVLSGVQAEIVSVGDSRAYHLDPLGLVQITRDHTMGDEARRSGEVPAGQLGSSRWAKALARFLGGEETVEVDRFGPFDLHEGGWLLLCSDGLHSVLSEEELEEHLREEPDPGRVASRLVESALAKNTEDNVSVALVYRPPKRISPAAPKPKKSVWDMETVITRSPRYGKGKGKGRFLLAVIVLIVVIPLLLVLLFVLNRALSTGFG